MTKDSRNHAGNPRAHVRILTPVKSRSCAPFVACDFRTRVRFKGHLQTHSTYRNIPRSKKTKNLDILRGIHEQNSNHRPAILAKIKHTLI